MRVIREPLIKRRYRLLTLLLIAISITLTITSLNTVYSLYTGLVNYVSSGPDTVIIFSNRSTTPFTGILDLSGIDKLYGIDGVYAVSPELPIPAYVNGSPVIVRGVYPDSFRAVAGPEMVEGEYIDGADYGAALVGVDLARALGIRLGDELLVASIFNKYFSRLRVVGVIRAGQPYDSEILVYIGVARHLRGVHGNYSSLIRVRVDPGRPGIEDVIRSVYINASPEAMVAGPVEVVDYYSNRVGLSPLVLFVAVVPPAILSIIVIKYLVGGLLDEHSDHIGILVDMGYREGEVRLSIYLQFLRYMSIAVIIGIVASTLLTSIIWMVGNISFLIHIPPPPSPIASPTIATIIYFVASGYYFYYGWVERG